MNKTLFLGVVSAALAPFAIQNSATAITLGFTTPTPATVEVGQQFDIGIAISGLGDSSAPSLGGFDFNVNFDSSILSFDSAAFGDPILGSQLDLDPDGFELINFADDFLSSLGTVNLFELSGDSDIVLDSSQPDSFTLAVLTFNAIAPGNSDLEISFDGIGSSLSDALGNPLDLSTVNINDSSIEIEPGVTTSVPESPTAIALLTLGLFGLRTKLVKKAK